MNETTVTVRLARCQSRDERGVLCWGTVALPPGRGTPPVLMPCGHAGREAEIRTVQGTYDPREACDPSCTSAIGADCICACGGANHGASWALTEAMGGRREGNTVIWDVSTVVTEDRRAEVMAWWEQWLTDAARRTAVRRIVTRHAAAAKAAETRRFTKAKSRMPDRVFRSVSSAAWAWQRQEWAREREQRAQDRDAKRLASEFVGREGERITVTATLRFVRAINGRFGLTILHGMEDDHGNSLRWFASGASPFASVKDTGRGLYDHQAECEPGETVTITGTVKRHETYREEKQTVLTRVSQVEDH